MTDFELHDRDVLADETFNAVHVDAFAGEDPDDDYLQAEADPTAPFLDLLAAIRDGLTIPEPDTDCDAHDRAVAQRAIWACVTIDMVLEMPEYVERLTTGLRERFVRTPVTYATLPAEARERAR